MNVLSDFEIRLRKLFPDTAEQDQIFKLGTQVIEKDMVIEKQSIEIAKLTKKIAKTNPDIKPTIKKTLKSSEKVSATEKPHVTKGATGKLKTNSKKIKKTAPIKSDKVKSNKK
jgi:uncharacterized coiled-coil protein SlyX